LFTKRSNSNLEECTDAPDDYHYFFLLVQYLNHCDEVQEMALLLDVGEWLRPFLIGGSNGSPRDLFC